jgi:hypothetical protein
VQITVKPTGQGAKQISKAGSGSVKVNPVNRVTGSKSQGFEMDDSTDELAESNELLAIFTSIGKKLT